jgi:hypothetical protein
MGELDVSRIAREIGACVIGVGLLIAIARPVAQESSIRKPGICARENPKVVGMRPLRTGNGVLTPTKVRAVKPNYPELPKGTVGTGAWVGEVLLSAEGKVSRIWPIHEVQFTPPFPLFNQAIVDAIRQWEYEPTVIKSEATPVCLTVTVSINWR